MQTVQVERTVKAPIDQVFELLTDHANYKQFRGIRDSMLLREGRVERNGVGAVRKVHFGPVRFEEEITAFERPVRMDYLIVKVNLPVKHEGGTIHCEEIDECTRVVWKSTFRVTVPGVGRLLGGVVAPVIKRGFRRILEDVDRLLTAS